MEYEKPPARRVTVSGVFRFAGRNYAADPIGAIF
jgi:hypothetical protein